MYILRDVYIPENKKRGLFTKSLARTATGDGEMKRTLKVRHKQAVRRGDSNNGHSQQLLAEKNHGIHMNLDQWWGDELGQQYAITYSVEPCTYSTLTLSMTFLWLSCPYY